MLNMPALFMLTNFCGSRERKHFDVGRVAQSLSNSRGILIRAGYNIYDT